MIRRLLPLVLLLAAILFPRVASATDSDTRTVVLISIDGFRWDYLDLYHPPALTAFAASGVRAGRLRPSFPSLTFPNHYTLVTGLRPARHGIIANSMFDPTSGTVFDKALPALFHLSDWWDGGEPIWVTAGRQGLRTGALFWPGAEVAIRGRRPDFWKPFDKAFDSRQRVALALDWLSRPPAARPRFLALYFDAVDIAGHKSGPGSAGLADAVADTDRCIGDFLTGLDRLQLSDTTDVVVASDHGMAAVPREHDLVIEDLTAPHSARVDFYGPFTGLRATDGDDEGLYRAIAARADHFQVWRSRDLPPRFLYSGNPRIPPVLLLADEGWRFAPRAKYADGWHDPGDHGFDPDLPSMGAFFAAAGPGLRHGVVIPAFDNTEVYDFLCTLLGIDPAPNDGRGDIATEILEK